jgi:large subunit ribosomal protein L24
MMVMKKEWSPRWLSSTQPRRQRKYRHNAPLHVRQGFVSANLSPELRKRFARRSMQLRKGDEARVMRGSLKGRNGTIDRIDLSRGRVYIDEIKVKKVDGSEVPRPLQPSNLMITKLKLDDKRRQAILDRAGKPGPAGAGAEEKPGTERHEALKKSKPARKGPAKPEGGKRKPRHAATKGIKNGPVNKRKAK